MDVIIEIEDGSTVHLVSDPECTLAYQADSEHFDTHLGIKIGPYSWVHGTSFDRGLQPADERMAEPYRSVIVLPPHLGCPFRKGSAHYSANHNEILVVKP